VSAFGPLPDVAKVPTLAATFCDSRLLRLARYFLNDPGAELLFVSEASGLFLTACRRFQVLRCPSPLCIGISNSSDVHVCLGLIRCLETEARILDRRVCDWRGQRRLCLAGRQGVEDICGRAGLWALDISATACSDADRFSLHGCYVLPPELRRQRNPPERLQRVTSWMMRSARGCFPSGSRSERPHLRF
jgi:hypothetical protein